MKATDTVIDALAVARLTRLVQQDDVWPMPEVRRAVLARAGASRWGDLVDCPYCLAVWIAAAVAGARALFPRAWPVAARVLATAAVAGHLAQVTRD